MHGCIPLRLLQDRHPRMRLIIPAESYLPSLSFPSYLPFISCFSRLLHLLPFLNVLVWKISKSHPRPPSLTRPPWPRPPRGESLRRPSGPSRTARSQNRPKVATVRFRIGTKLSGWTADWIRLLSPRMHYVQGQAPEV